MKAKDFVNDGFGWACRHCLAEIADDCGSGTSSGRPLPRLFTEGEAESKTPTLANPALARWADPARRMLVCPHCGITELIDVA
ncbi:MAG: hypothetical protein C4325_08380 [Blastocatellia bacterium]